MLEAGRLGRGCSLFTFETARTTETTEPRDENWKRPPLKYCKFQYFEESRKPWKPRDEIFEKNLETNLASRWEGVKLPWASGKSPETSPEVPRNFPRSSLTVDLNSNPEVPGSSPNFPQSSPPEVPQTSPEISPFPWTPDTLSWLTKLSLNNPWSNNPLSALQNKM